MFSELNPRIISAVTMLYSGNRLHGQSYLVWLCVHHAACNSAKHVPDSSTFTQTDAPNVWWKMDKLFRYSSPHYYVYSLMIAALIKHNVDVARRKRSLMKKL
jgi:hypothetical protein